MRLQLVLVAALASCASPARTPADPWHQCSRSSRPPPVRKRLVTMMDACDPETFNNANVRCVRSGGVTFQHFLELLGEYHAIGAWHFTPGTINARVGQALLAVNQGGEVHTFTEVRKFGGGVVDVLNQLSGNPVPAPECQSLPTGKFIAPGSSQTDELEDPGIEHYQRCIHPWMRLDVHVRP